MEDFIVIGKIKGVYGRNGAVKVLPLTDFPRRFDIINRIFLSDGEKSQPTEYEIELVTYQKKFVGMKLVAVNDQEAAWALNNRLVVLPLEERMALEAHSYYISDLIGLKVLDLEGNCLGRLDNVIETGASSVFVITKNGRELLLPALKETVKDVDLTKGIVTVNPRDYLDGN